MMSTETAKEKEKKEQERLMAEFWQAFGTRLATSVPTEKINEFAILKKLDGFRLDRVVQGKKGVDMKTLLKICKILDLSPTWLLFGIGPKRKSDLELSIPDIVDRIVQEIRPAIDQETRRKIRAAAYKVADEFGQESSQPTIQKDNGAEAPQGSTGAPTRIIGKDSRRNPPNKK